MKNIIKLTLLSAAFAVSTTVMAQESIKNTAASTSNQLEAPQTTNSKTEPAPQDGKTAPQSGKITPQDGTKKDASKTDTTKTGGTRMAITEQGVPKKNKNKKASTPTGTTDPAKKKEGN